MKIKFFLSFPVVCHKYLLSAIHHSGSVFFRMTPSGGSQKSCFMIRLKVVWGWQQYSQTLYLLHPLLEMPKIKVFWLKYSFFSANLKNFSGFKGSPAKFSKFVLKPEKWYVIIILWYLKKIPCFLWYHDFQQFKTPKLNFWPCIWKRLRCIVIK